MKINIKVITESVSRVAAMTIGDKITPNIMIDTTDAEETQKIKLCYYDGHKAYIESIDVVTEENDIFNKLIVSFESFQRAIDNCQPSGKRKIDEVLFGFDDRFINIKAEQYTDIEDIDGNNIGHKVMGIKSMRVAWSDVNKDIKTKLVDRMDYSSIFDDTIIADTYTAKELSSALNKTSTERAKITYIGKNTQSVFVNNTAHVTSVPISGYEVTLEEKDIIRGEMIQAGTYTDEEFNKAIKNKTDRIHFSIMISDNMCKSIMSIIDKSGVEEVNVFTKDGKYCHINIEMENDNKIGIWFEMPNGSKMDLGAFDRFNSLQYDAYQLDIMTEFLSDTIKSALVVSGSDKIIMKFEESDDNIILVISPSNSMNNIDDRYTVVINNIVDNKKDLMNSQFNISLKVFNDMISQINSEFTALDFQVQPDGTVCVRLSELMMDKLENEYSAMRKDTEELCNSEGIQFLPDQTKTPDIIRIRHRKATLGTNQFTTLAR